MKKDSKRLNSRGKTNDDIYAWHTRFGKTNQEVFDTIKANILKIIDCTQRGDLKSIDSIDISHNYKWKIAFVYGNENVVPVFNEEWLKLSLEYFGEDYSSNIKMSELNNKLIKHKKDNEDFLLFSDLSSLLYKIQISNAYIPFLLQIKSY